MSDLICTAMETAMRRRLATVLGPLGFHAYAAHEAVEQLMPCVVVTARKSGLETAVRSGGRYASLVSLAFTCRVHASLADCDRLAAALAARAEAALETATAADVAAFALFDTVDPTEQHANIEGRREITLGWTVRAALI